MPGRYHARLLLGPFGPSQGIKMLKSGSMAAALGAKRNDDAPVTDSQGNTYSPVTAEWIRNLGRMR